MNCEYCGCLLPDEYHPNCKVCGGPRKEARAKGKNFHVSSSVAWIDFEHSADYPKGAARKAAEQEDAAWMRGGVDVDWFSIAPRIQPPLHPNCRCIDGDDYVWEGEYVSGYSAPGHAGQIWRLRGDETND